MSGPSCLSGLSRSVCPYVRLSVWCEFLSDMLVMSASLFVVVILLGAHAARGQVDEAVSWFHRMVGARLLPDAVLCCMMSCVTISMHPGNLGIDDIGSKFI